MCKPKTCKDCKYFRNLGKEFFCKRHEIPIEGGHENCEYFKLKETKDHEA